MPPPTATDETAAAQLSGLLESAMDAIVSVDESQRVVLYNRAAERIFGWTAAEMLGRSLDLLIPVRYRHRHDRQLQRFGRTGTTSRCMGDATVLHALRKDGSEFPIEASISQLAMPDGRLFTVILRDITERERAHQERAALASAFFNVREQEKSRVARELHDELAQGLTALKIDAMWLFDRSADNGAMRQKIESMLSLIDDSVASVRRIAADLRPLVLDDLGLLAAIEWLGHNFEKRTGVNCRLELEELGLKEPLATAVFRIIQESLNNVAKHAAASQVRVLLAREGEVLRVATGDDGIGFDPLGDREPHSLGLAGIRERAQLLNGEVEVSSRPGVGTRIEVRLPLQQEPAA